MRQILILRNFKNLTLRAFQKLIILHNLMKRLKNVHMHRLNKMIFFLKVTKNAISTHFEKIK